ncbi:MAG: orotidine-5'-phosphate decarboxylase [Acetobacter sp.]|nr:orotidine-5'-phosphate decarboxylase [Acetobacter sp.]
MPYQHKPTGLIVALDTQSRQQAHQWIDEVGDLVGMVKLGLEFTYAAGFSAVAEIGQRVPLFLDLKLHDIPNTVAAAIRALSFVQPRMLTIHASGGSAMIEAARHACDLSFPSEKRPLLLGVTVLTSLDEKALAETGVEKDVQAQVLTLGALALRAGCDGLVCSARELKILRDQFGQGPVLVAPGIRPSMRAENHPGIQHKTIVNDDQKRFMTPAQAHQAGADWVVVGRPITQATEKRSATLAIISELSL